ncbi:MAG TPA: deoxyuridine 5'-triphosphate nucleotidohydrolase [Dehalococcoidia bacterium]|nr:deoxyuridine 5'-triphosphate nucleotidohydrolase [Dehalococcoidia bacterium]
MNHGALDRQSIKGLVLGDPPLVEGYASLEEQLQPNGFDLRVQDIGHLVSAGGMGRRSADRELSEVAPVEFNPDSWVQLAPGPYLITFSEVVNLPLGLMALGRPRSSLLRSGVSLHTAVWDAGYRGRSQALLVVHQPLGYRLQQGARVMQLVFFTLAQGADQGYQGRFLGENL